MTDGLARVRVDVSFASGQEAQRAADALAPDNGAHLGVTVEGTVLVLEATASSALGALRSVDDAIACLRALGVP